MKRAPVVEKGGTSADAAIQTALTYVLMRGTRGRASERVKEGESVLSWIESEF